MEDITSEFHGLNQFIQMALSSVCEAHINVYFSCSLHGFSPLLSGDYDAFSEVFQKAFPPPFTWRTQEAPNKQKVTNNSSLSL